MRRPIYNPKKILPLLVALMASTARGQDAGTFSLFDDYNCPDALPMTPVDGGWFATEPRKERIDCALKGCQGELNDWRPSKNAAAPPPDNFKLQPSHGVFALVSVIVTTYLTVVKSRADQHCRGVMVPWNPC